MPDSLHKQIADAIIARCAAIAGIGDTDIEPRKLSSVGKFPCVFIESAAESKAMRTMAAQSSEKTAVLTITLQFFTLSPAPLVSLFPVDKSIEDAIETLPFDLGVEGVFITKCEGGEFLRYSEDNRIYGYGKKRVAVSYNQLYGSA